MAGRKPKPTALKLLAGNPGKRKPNKSEPKPPPGAPEMPWYLTPEAKEEWERILPLLAKVPGLLSRIDGTALGSYCMAFARWIEAEEEISQHGVLVKEPCFDRQGNLVGDRLRKNPACTAAMASQKEMRALLALFGMDPSNRSRIQAGSEDEHLSPLMAMLKARQQTKGPAPQE